MFSLLAELIVSSLVHQTLQLVRVRQLTLIQQQHSHLQLHEPTLLHRRLVHERRSLRKSLTLITQQHSHSVHLKNLSSRGAESIRSSLHRLHRREGITYSQTTQHTSHPALIVLFTSGNSMYTISPREC